MTEETAVMKALEMTAYAEKHKMKLIKEDKND